MKVTFLGGANEVGASSTLLEIAGKKLLIDAGIRVSSKSTRGIESDQLPDLQQVSAAGGPDYILVTHAHTDHTGALPLVLEQYPKAPVFATAPTIALTKVLQADAQIIMKNRQEEEGELPLFDEVAVGRLLDAFQTVEFLQPIRLGDGLQVTYHPSGHILGAAALVIESDEGIVVMSGDVSMTQQWAVGKAQVPKVKADFLVLESTYGGRLHANRSSEEDRLIETLQRVVERGGKALIPAFALGRAQEVIQILLNNKNTLDVPVWVDGMVRAVCQAYMQFPELLPSRTVKAAKEDHLFFRRNIKPVKTAVQREEIARSEGPCVIVSSSGMLTGGPSAAFAKWLAGDERNGIFLTGYQDEESPGRFLQNMLKQKERGEEVAFRIDDTTVSLRCELGTYSLSAHADEGELVSIANAFDADDVALVHGDKNARHSLSMRLRDRGKTVRLPNSGMGYELKYAKRTRTSENTVAKGNQVRPLDPQVLWELLKVQAGNFFSAEELAVAWWGDAERAGEVVTILAADQLYFAQDWRKSTTFQVRTPEKVERSLNQHAIMRAHPNLIGQVIIMYDVNEKMRIAVVTDADIDSFKAKVLRTRGQQYSADSLVWAIGDLATFPTEEPEMSLTKRLTAIWQQFEILRDTIMPFEKRKMLYQQGEPINPHDLVPNALPEGVTPEIALGTVVYSLAKDGVTRVGDQLVLKQVQASEPLEMNLARKTALATFPSEARLRKVGMEIANLQLNLVFDFPLVAQEKYADTIDLLHEQTGWEIKVTAETNQQALGAVLHEVLPSGGKIVKGPSFYIAQQKVQVEVADVEDVEAFQKTYQEITGFELVVNAKVTVSSTSEGVTEVAVSGTNEPMEINKAYTLIRETLEPYGLYKAGLKQGQIVLSFITPQVGKRHETIITELAEKIGYPMTIYPNPNQNALIQTAQRYARDAGLTVVRGPSVHMDRGEVVMGVPTAPPLDIVYEIGRYFEDETGYQLIFEI